MSFEYCHLVEFRNACQCSPAWIGSENASDLFTHDDVENATEIDALALVARELLPCFCGVDTVRTEIALSGG